MVTGRTTVFLPCHALDDFPTWLEETEADDLLAAWTAAWHPALCAATGATPTWASVDLPPPAGPLLGIVPATCDDRFAAQAAAAGLPADRFVRGVRGRDAIVAAALAAAGTPAPPALAGQVAAADFFALGLAVLLAELLARRMRSSIDLTTGGFPEALLRAARAALAGGDVEARTALQECFACLEATRAHYYPVDIWLVDVVLLAPTTLGRALRAELEAPVPVALVAGGETIATLEQSHPDSLAALREALDAGRGESCGGRDDDRPLDLLGAEELLASLERGRAAWCAATGAAPATFARIGGGLTPLVPQLLAGLGCGGAIWCPFDGAAMPDPGSGRIRWEAPDGSGVEALARPPLDARSAATVLALPDAIGDALDHDHAAAILFAHYAGTASPWHDLVRRIGGWSTLLGRFVTPAGCFAATAGCGQPVSLAADAFPPSPPPGGEPGADPLGRAVAAAEREAARIVAAAAPVVAALTAPPPSPVAIPRPRRVAGWFSGTRAAAERTLDNGLVRMEIHPRTGGILSLRRPADRANRVSQQLAVRSTRAAPPGGRWEAPEERASFSRMEVDTIERQALVEGESIVSRGRLLDAAGAPLGGFTQRVRLAAGLPLAVLDIDVELAAAPVGAVLENHLACRFAWHENEEVTLRRSLHLQAVDTERPWFTAPHFIEVLPTASRSRAGLDGVTILTGGLPWHVRSSPHVLDTLLLAGARTARRRLGLGIGLERPWDAALALLAAATPVAAGLPPNVRLTVHDTSFEAGRLVAARIGLLESAGLPGGIRIEWTRPPTRAVACDLAGTPRPDVTVAIDGRATVVSLSRYQWLHLDLGFGA